MKEMKATKKLPKGYKEFLKENADKFKITPEDINNLSELEMLMPYWFIQEVLVPNGMKEWYDKFFGKIRNITLEEGNFLIRGVFR